MALFLFLRSGRPVGSSVLRHHPRIKIVRDQVMHDWLEAQREMLATAAAKARGWYVVPRHGAARAQPFTRAMFVSTIAKLSRP